MGKTNTVTIPVTRHQDGIAITRLEKFPSNLKYADLIRAYCQQDLRLTSHLVPKKFQPNCRIRSVWPLKYTLDFQLEDGRLLAIPRAWYPKLHRATLGQLLKYEIVADGHAVRWPALDEDLEIHGLLAGNAAPPVRVPKPAWSPAVMRATSELTQTISLVIQGVRAKFTELSEPALQACVDFALTRNCQLSAPSLREEIATAERELVRQRLTAAGKLDGKAIKALRGHLKLSQAEFGRQLGVRQATISDWERGRTDKISSLAKARLVDFIKCL